MKEIAFTVNKDSQFYKNYFLAKEERQKFHELAKAFFKKHNLFEPKKYYQTEFLGLELTAEQKKLYADQIKKHDDENGMTRFKKRSAMQKSWEEDVVSKVDFDVIEKPKFWWFDFIMRGSYSLWDHDGVIYGYLKDNHKEEIKLADYMTEIKMSEYYMAIEATEQ